MAPLKLICPGVSRTGTDSLRTALNMLGYNTMHFMNFSTDLTLDMDGFQNAIDNREEADWDKLYENYDATVDIPTWIWYKDLMKKYPEAKIILTVRDSESWYTSISNIRAILRDPKNKATSEIHVRSKSLLQSFLMSSDILKPEVVKNKEAAMDAFDQHNKEVTEYVPKEKLYVMKLGEGWEGICKFLDKPIPDAPYPHRNAPKQFQEYIEEKKKRNIESLSVSEPQ